jgi:uncharacterized protein (TIGR02145 family)
MVKSIKTLKMKEQKLDWQLLLLLMSMVFLSTCTKVERTNPYDEKANLNPDEWSPSNLKIENIDYTSIKISWEYLDNNIEGFRLDRRENGGEWQNSYQTFNKTDRSFIDTTIDTTRIINYEYRLYAFAGVNKSTMMLINYSISKPIISTTNISNITRNTAKSGGNITSDGGLPITARGVCWSTSQNPTTVGSHTTNGKGTGSFTSNITGLTIHTFYYVRAYATNSLGTEYGANETFNISDCVDFDGNIYETVVIGTQEWMAENLKVTHYRNGEPISNITDATQWGNLSTGAYCWYNNDEAAFKNIYGALYDYYSVVDSRNLCPAGWHIPSDAEWSTLTNYLGGESVAGGKLKETGTIHWQSPNTAATNESGFTGLPGGYRNDNGKFNSLGYLGLWWSYSKNDANGAWYRYLNYVNGDVDRNGNSMYYGFSVRCVRD